MRLSATLAAAIMVLTVLAVGGPGEARAQSAAFTFPVTYGAPTPPSSVGAQGSQGAFGAIGPNIAGSATGASGHTGPVGKTYPYEFAVTAATLHLRVFNGTLHPNTATPASHARITLTNVTSGVVVSASATTLGFANLSTTVGWFILNVNTTGGHINSTEELWVSSSLTISRYLISSSFTIAVVGNHGTTTTLWSRIGSSSMPAPKPGVRVDLHNGSFAGATLATAYTGSNGTVEFTSVNTAFSYTFTAIGWNSTLTDLRYYQVNNSCGSFTATPINSYECAMWGYTSYTASVAGTAPLTGASTQSAWILHANTAVSNGNIYISSALEGNTPNLYSLTFTNSVVYWNWTGAGVNVVGLRLFFQNSTLVFLSQSSFLQTATSVWFNASLLLGSSVPADHVAAGSCGYELTFNSSLSSGFEHLSAPCSFQTSIGQSFQGRFVNSVFTNDTYLQFGIAPNSPTHFVSTSFVSSFLPRGSGPQSNVSFDKVRFTSTSVLATTWSRLWMNSSSLVNTTWYEDQGAVNTTASVGNHVGTAFINNTWLNFTYNGSMKIVGMDNFNGFYRNDYVGFQIQGGKTIGQVVTAVKTLPYNTLMPGEHSVGVILLLPAQSNFTSTYINGTESPSTNFTIWFLGGSGQTQFYRSVVTANYTVAQLTTLSSSLSSPPLGLFSIRDVNNAGITANYSTLNLGTGGVLNFGTVLNLTHDSFPEFFDINWWGNSQPFQNLPPGKAQVRIANDTFYRWDVSPAISTILARYSSVATNYPVCCFPAQVLELSQGYGVKNASVKCSYYPCSGSIYVGYNTFYARPSGILQSEWVMESMPFIANGLDHNLFWNNPSYSNIEWSPPFSCDMFFRGQFFNATSNWFYGLNNATLPYCEQPYTVNQINNQNTRATFVNDHFYYAPYPGTPTVSPYGPWFGKETVTGGAHEPFTGSSIPSQSVLSYSVLMPPNGTIATPDLSQFMFNSTGSVLTNPVYGTHEYAWGIAPDVNESNGVPEVSYAWGSEGGLQPNFTFSGHRYTSSVEPTYVNISADSSSAPSIGVGLMALPGLAALYVYNATTQAQISLNYVTVPASGIYNATFSPSTQSAGVIFDIIPFSSPFFHGNLDGLILLAFGLTIAASFVVYVTHRKKREGEWWG